MKHLRILALAATAFLAGSTVASAQQAYTTSSVNLRAGPSTRYPAVIRLPPDSRVFIHGCVRSFDWCDVSWRRFRGWVISDGLEAVWRNRRVEFDDYRDYVEIPYVSFGFGYWDRYYRDRPWFNNWDRWGDRNDRRWNDYRGKRGNGGVDRNRNNNAGQDGGGYGNSPSRNNNDGKSRGNQRDGDQTDNAGNNRGDNPNDATTGNRGGNQKDNRGKRNTNQGDANENQSGGRSGPANDNRSGNGKRKNNNNDLRCGTSNADPACGDGSSGGNRNTEQMNSQ
ncbi:SH3 domain-containing protein [Aestuariivirga sp.]|uniref:SH3 domain-containing protein n=1 Tax=Aestuariivirga sp. TaxID=2650926 RepID=UPI003BABD128